MESKFERLKSDCDKMHGQYMKLTEEYNKLRHEYDKLKKSHEVLVENWNRITSTRKKSDQRKINALNSVKFRVKRPRKLISNETRDERIKRVQFKLYTKSDLVLIGKELGLGGISGLNKQQLCERVEGTYRSLTKEQKDVYNKVCASV
jgi:predicted nuclease with TOPRIM domain